MNEKFHYFKFLDLSVVSHTTVRESVACFCYMTEFPSSVYSFNGAKSETRQRMASSLSSVGVFWSLCSFVSAILCCSGFYLPFWIQGRLLDRADAYFSSFRRCNYPRLTSRGDIEIVMECGRYSRFQDIPSVWWQVTTVLMCIGCALSMLAAVISIAACCFSYVLHSTSAKTTGALQLLAALLMTGGCAVYPLGWDNRQVRESCGNLSAAYKLGTCQLSWSVYILCTAVTMLLFCSLLSICAAKNS